MKSLALLLALGTATAAAAAEPLLPLPEAPVVLFASDPAGLDRVLAGGLRAALSGKTGAEDPVMKGLRQTRVGAKLDEQWALFAADLPLSWTEIAAMKPTALGLALLSAGNLEAVLAIRTPLAQIPVTLPAGEARSRAGVSYAVVSRGAGDERTLDRRIGLAWARVDGTLLLATSERALLLALDRAAAKQGYAAFLPGLLSARLDLAALRGDRYFRREFLFAEGLEGSESGVLLCALREENGRLVEVREGEAAAGPAAARWSLDGRRVAAAGWETSGRRFPPALRRGLLEPVPSPATRPGLALKPLPDPNAAQGERYLVDLTKPIPASGEGDAAELPRWAAFLDGLPVEGWGWEAGADGSRRLLLKVPPAKAGRARRPREGDADAPRGRGDPGVVAARRRPGAAGPRLGAAGRLALARREREPSRRRPGPGAGVRPRPLEPPRPRRRPRREGPVARRGGRLLRGARPPLLRPDPRPPGLGAEDDVGHRREAPGGEPLPGAGRLRLEVILAALLVFRLAGDTVSPGAEAAAPRPVGSLQKPWVVAAWARAHPHDEPPRLDCTAQSGCWRPSGHGRVDLSRAFAQSCNAYFLALARATPEDVRARALEGAGFELSRPLSPEATIGLGPLDALPRVSPATLLGAYRDLLTRPWPSRDALRLALVDGMRAAALDGTGAALAQRGYLAKTGTVPALDGRPLATSGWALAASAGGESLVLALLPDGTGAMAAAALGEELGREGQHRDDLRPRRRLAWPPLAGARPRPAPRRAPSRRRDRVERRRRTRPNPPSASRRRVAGSRCDRRRRAGPRDRPGSPSPRRRAVRSRPVRRGDRGDLGKRWLSAASSSPRRPARGSTASCAESCATAHPGCAKSSERRRFASCVPGRATAATTSATPPTAPSSRDAVLSSRG